MKPASGTVAFLFNADKPAARRVIPRFNKWFRSRGWSVASGDRLEGAQAVVAVGGDGTLLLAARKTAPLGIPVLGVNLGRLGFLTTTGVARAESLFSRLTAGRLPRSSRCMLEASVAGRASRLALNEGVIRGTGGMRVIHLEVRVDGQSLGRFVADGLIVATPTGSTAYSLAAGGPVVTPELDALLLTPICPHSLTQRPLVVGPESRVDVSLLDAGRGEKVFLCLDGQLSAPLRRGERVTFRRARERFHAFVDPRAPFFSVLRQKLRWGERG
jgi:NAD+ kinase